MATKIDLAVSMVLDSKGVVVGFRDVKNKVRDLEGQFMKLNDTLKEVKRGSEEFQGAASRAMETYQKQTRTAGTATSNFKSKLDDMFKPITTINQAFGLLQQTLYVVQRAFQLTVGSAIDLELQVARINTVLDESERGQVDFAKQILQMQATFGANPTEAAKGFYEAIASGATNAAGSIELMATAQKLAIGGLLPLDKALSGLTAVMASYGYTAEQTKFISDGFFIAAAKGKTNVEELTQEIGNVSSIAQQSGVSFAELVSSISAVTLGGKRTAEATTSVRSAINALLTPTEQLQYVFDQLNIKSVTQEIRQRGLAAVYKDIYKYVNNNADSLAKLVGRIEAISAVVALTTGKQADAYRAMVDEINDSNRQMGERTEQASNMIRGTAAENIKVAKESIAASFTDISQIAMKLVVPAMTAIAAALNAILKPIVFVTDQMELFANSLDGRVVPTVLAGSAAIAGIVAMLNMGFIPAMIALGGALKIAIVPLLILSAKIIAIGAAITLVLAAVDSFVRNWELIPVAFEYVIAKFDEIKIRFFKLMNDMFIGLANIISDNAKKFPKIAEIFGLSDFAEKSKSQLNLVNEQFGQELDKTVKRAEEAKKKIVSTFDVGAFGALKDIGKSIFSGGPEQIFGPPKPPQTGAPGLPETEQKPGKDIGKAIEDRNKLQEQLNTMLGNTARYEEEIRMSQVYGNDSLRESLKIEFEKIDTLAAQLEKHKALTAEQQKGIVKFKETAAKAIEIKVNTENIKQATGYINAAAGGADAVVSKAINQVGAAFGPKGEMIAAAVNLLRMGGEQMKTLGQGLIQVFIELPLKVAEGAVGLVQGIIDGVINMIADPAKLAKISTAIITLVPKIITALAKGIPVVLKTLLNPSFWVELVAQIVRSIFDAFKEMFFAIGDLIAGIFTGDIFTPDEEKAVDFGTTAAESFNSSIQMSTGYGEQLFGVQNEGVQAALQGVEATAQKVNKSFADGVKKQDSWWNKFVKDWHSFWTDFDQNFLKKIWDGFGDIFRSLWEGIKGFSSALGDFFGKIWEVLKGFIGSIGQVFVELWGTLKEIGKFIWDGIVSVSKEIGDFFVDIGKKVWDGIESTAGKIGDFFKNLGSKIWDGLKDAIKSFGGAIADFLGFSDGGIVPGLSLTSGDNPKNDTVPTLLSPGEAVIPRSLMANPEINKMIKNLLNNRQMPLSIDVGMPRIAMANGGVVPLNPIISNNGGTTFGDTNINVVLKIDTKEPIDETFIRQRLIPAMKAELKASSLRGDFVLSSKGVRR